MFSVNFSLGILLDLVVLFYAAKFLGVPGNSPRKALMVTAISALAGYFVGEILIRMVFFPLISFFLLLAPLVLIGIVFFRLFVIKFVYGIGFGRAFGLWLVSAAISVIASVFLPF